MMAACFNLIALLLILSLPWSGQQAWSAPAGEERQAPSGRNPFAYPPRILKELAAAKTGDGKPGAAAPAPEKVYTLTGILWTERGGVASINRRLVQEGDRLDEYRVHRVDQSRVVLRKDGEEIVLNLFQSPVVVTRHQDGPPPRKKK